MKGQERERNRRNINKRIRRSGG